MRLNGTGPPNDPPVSFRLKWGVGNLSRAAVGRKLAFAALADPQARVVRRRDDVINGVSVRGMQSVKRGGAEGDPDAVDQSMDQEREQ